MDMFLISLGAQGELDQPQNGFAICETDSQARAWNKRFIKILSPKIGRGRRSNAPLFSGRLMVQKRRTASDTDDEFLISLQLSINPTRFCNYQLPITQLAGRRGFDNVVLFATQDCIAHGECQNEEYSLDSSDNVLFSPSSKTHASSRFWWANLRRYIESIELCLSERLGAQSLLHPSFTAVRSKREYSLRSLESYFEIMDETPVVAVKDMRSAFWALGNNTSESIYTESRDMHAEGCSIALRREFKTGEKLKVYAKTNKRIRIEISKKLFQNPRLSPSGGYTRNSIGSLISLIRELSADSRGLLVDFATEFDSYTSRTQLYQFSAWRFLKVVLKVIPDSYRAMEVLDLIMGNGGGLQPSFIPISLRPHVRDLVKHGVVEYKSRPTLRYVIAPRYLSAVSAMTS